MFTTSTPTNANTVPRYKGRMLPLAMALALLLGISVSIGDVRAAADEPADFDSLRDRWVRVLTGGVEVDLSVPEIADKALGVGAQAQAVWGSLNTADEREYLWPDHLPSETSSNWINGSYREVLTMARGFATQGSGLYGDHELETDIVAALEWLHINAQQSVEQTDNSWNLLIGIQIRMGHILTLMHESLTDEQIHRFVDVLDGYTTEITPLDYGANRSDKIMSKLLQMIAIEDGERMAYYRDQVSVLFEYVTVGDGMYGDGSWSSPG